MPTAFRSPAIQRQDALVLTHRPRLQTQAAIRIRHRKGDHLLGYVPLSITEAENASAGYSISCPWSAATSPKRRYAGPAGRADPAPARRLRQRMNSRQARRVPGSTRVGSCASAGNWVRTENRLDRRFYEKRVRELRNSLRSGATSGSRSRCVDKDFEDYLCRRLFAAQRPAGIGPGPVLR